MSNTRSRVLVLTVLAGTQGLGCQEFVLSDRDEVVAEPVVVVENFTQTPLPKVDILWVIDDTASMDEEVTKVLHLPQLMKYSHPP
ncbi:MAG: hypothetical protein QGG40_17195 [Myxococcota bacterium]|nr:hypothetical protein [Myxococcota bacterium]